MRTTPLSHLRLLREDRRAFVVFLCQRVSVFVSLCLCVRVFVFVGLSLCPSVVVWRGVML